MGYYKNQEHAKRDSRSSGKPAAGKSRTGGNAVRWNNVSLTAEQKAWLREQALDAERAVDTLTRFVEAGYKLVITPKNDRGFVSATLLGFASECPDEGFGVSGEGGTAVRAILSLLLKLDILDGQLSFVEAPPDDDFR